MWYNFAFLSHDHQWKENKMFDLPDLHSCDLYQTHADQHRRRDCVCFVWGILIV